MRFQTIVDSISTAACILSVEKAEGDSCGKIRVVTGNRIYMDSIEKPVKETGMLARKFVPGCEYTEYVAKDLNFEEACYQAAVKKKCIHSYAHPARYDIWFNMTFVPLMPDEGDICYCLYIMEINFKPDAKRLSALSADIACSVLETCIKLQNPDDFRAAMKAVCSDIRDLCDSEHCCILLMDTVTRQCSVLCEAFSKDSKLLPMDRYVDDAFYDIAYSWLDTIGGSNCLIIKNESDMELVRERNPVWHHSITSAGGKTIVLFPLMFKNELLGDIWASNFDTENSRRIKDTLELTTFFLSSEIASYNMMQQLEHISFTDILTGINNRNAMNNRVDKILSGKNIIDKPYGVVFSDLNGLKTVNDKGGHTAGDLLIKKAALLLQEIFIGDEIYRAGGDEFMVIVSDCSEEEFSRKVLMLRQRASDPDKVCFSVGCFYNDLKSSITDAMRIADEAMYKDKERYYAEHPERRNIR